MFHVAPFESRESIERLGLHNEFSLAEVWSNCDDWDDGTYLWERLDQAERYRAHEFPLPADIYEVDVEGLILSPDMTGNSPVEGAWFSPQVIEPKRLSIVSPLESCLYHGTTGAAWDQIKTEGLSSAVFLTSSFHAALDYGTSKARVTGDFPVVIRVDTGARVRIQPNGTWAPPFFFDDWHQDSGMPGEAWIFDREIPAESLTAFTEPTAA